MGDTKEFLEEMISQVGGRKPVVEMNDIMAYRAQQRANGNPVAEVMDGLPQIYSGDQFPQQYELKKRKPLVDGLFRAGDNVLLSGPPKMGKSWFYSTLAICMASGEKFMDLDVAKCNILMVDLELHRDDVMGRLWDIAQAMGMKTVPKDLYLWSLRGAQYDLDTFVEVIRHRLDSLPEMDAIFIDPIYLLEGDGSFDENSNSAVTTLLRELQQIVKERGSALMLSHHYRKGNMGKENHIDRTSGAGAFNRFPDSMMTLSYHDEPYHAILEVTGRSMPSMKPFSIRMVPPKIERRDLEPKHKSWK